MQRKKENIRRMGAKQICRTITKYLPGAFKRMVSKIDIQILVEKNNWNVEKTQICLQISEMVI